MKPGIYPGMSRDQYQTIKAVNISTLVHGVKSMAHLRLAMNTPREETDALRLGIATHIAVFESSRVDSFFIAPKRGRRSNEDKQWWADFEAKAVAAKGIVLTEEEAATVYAIRDSLRANKTTREILDAQGVGEMAAVWEDKETGILCKGIVDRFCQWNGWPVIPDLKTARDVTKRGFERAIAEHNYHVKAAWYCDGFDSIAKAERRFLWIAVENVQPHAVALYEPDAETMDEGRKVYRRLLTQYAECTKTGIWPAFPEGIEPISLPKWAKEKEFAA